MASVNKELFCSIKNNEECMAVLDEMKKMNLSEKMKKIVDDCVTILQAKEDEDVPFTLDIPLKLAAFAMKNPEIGNKAIEVGSYITRIVDTEYESNNEIYLLAASAEVALSSVLTNKEDEEDDDEFQLSWSDE